MNRYLLTGLIALSSCTQVSMDASETSSSATSVSASLNQAPSPVGYCEFTLGEAIPAGKSFVSKEAIPTEGDERIFYTYKACDGSKLVKVELVKGVIDSIEISGNGNCIESLACVGDTYKEVLDKNPKSRLYLSQIEGGAFALIIRENLDVYFDRNAIPLSCYDSPALPSICEKTIHESRVIALLLHQP